MSTNDVGKTNSISLLLLFFRLRENNGNQTTAKPNNRINIVIFSCEVAVDHIIMGHYDFLNNWVVLV